MESNIIVTRLEVLLHLPFISIYKNNLNVCYANNIDVRVEYRDNFNERDIVAYLIGIMGCKYFSQYNSVRLEVPFPKSVDNFWEVIKIKNKHSLIDEVLKEYTVSEFFATFLVSEKWSD